MLASMLMMEKHLSLGLKTVLNQTDMLKDFLPFFVVCVVLALTHYVYCLSRSSCLTLYKLGMVLSLIRSGWSFVHLLTDSVSSGRIRYKKGNDIVKISV